MNGLGTQQSIKRQKPTQEHFAQAFDKTTRTIRR